MAPQQTSAETQAMSVAAQRVDDATQTIAVIGQRVAGIVANTAIGYNTPGAAVFRSAMEAWDQDFTTINNGLKAIYEALGGTAANFNQAMTTDEQSVNEISALLNGTAH
jgi:uncharacterized protein YukE